MSSAPASVFSGHRGRTKRGGAVVAGTTSLLQALLVADPVLSPVESFN